MREFEIDLPQVCPREGFIGEILEEKTRVGFWIMPDCRTDPGKLEDFLHELIPDDDLLLPFAKTCVDQATEVDPRFEPKDRIKALIHTWLAWQKNPGMAFGTAIRTEYFNHDTEVAQRFVAWFKKLFDL